MSNQSKHDTNLRKFCAAFAEAAAPELRAAVYGRETSKKRFREELLRQLDSRNVCEVDTDTENTEPDDE